MILAVQRDILSHSFRDSFCQEITIAFAVALLLGRVSSANFSSEDMKRVKVEELSKDEETKLEARSVGECMLDR